MHRSQLGGFIIDCQSGDLDEAAAFWAKALGLPAEDPQSAGHAKYRELRTEANDLHVEVQKVDHPSRVHLDIETDDIEAEVQRLEALGAKRVGQVESWWVMEAPTGHRFCVVEAERENFESEANVWPE